MLEVFAPMNGAVSAAGAAMTPATTPRAADDSAREDDPDTRLEQALARLAERAALHHSLLYSFQCDEDVTRRVIRALEFAHSGVVPEQTMHVRQGILLEQRRDRVATAVRVKVDKRGRVKMSSKTHEPVVIELPREFGPIASAVPHAQAAIFTAEGQASMRFRLLDGRGSASSATGRKEERRGEQEPAGEPTLRASDPPREYRIHCNRREVAIEFLDRVPPRKEARCSALASGQICLDVQSGEISRIVFYGLDEVNDVCVWNREAPFTMVEQGLVEPETGARFPSRVKTLFTLDRRDTAEFEQRFEHCGFTHVEVTTTYGGSGGASNP